MPQHMRVRLELKPSRLPSTFNHPGESRSGERCAAFAGEHERRLRLLLLCQPSESPQLIPPDGMRGWRSLLDPADCQGPGVEIDLIPSKINQFGGPQAM